MNIGSLYTVKMFYWFLFPTKAIAAVTDHHAATLDDDGGPLDAAFWSGQLNCEVTYFSPDCYIVFLEEEGKFKKILTSDGRIGWTWFGESYNDCFEEVKSE